MIPEANLDLYKIEKSTENGNYPGKYIKFLPNELNIFKR